MPSAALARGYVFVPPQQESGSFDSPDDLDTASQRENTQRQVPLPPRDDVSASTAGGEVESDVQDDEPCRVSALSTAAVGQLNTHERGLCVDPDCDEDVAFCPAQCNYVGLGQ